MPRVKSFGKRGVLFIKLSANKGVNPLNISNCVNIVNNRTLNNSEPRTSVSINESDVSSSKKKRKCLQFCSEVSE